MKHKDIFTGVLMLFLNLSLAAHRSKANTHEMRVWRKSGLFKGWPRENWRRLLSSWESQVHKRAFIGRERRDTRQEDCVLNGAL